MATGGFEQTANRIRELNDKLIQLAKESGHGCAAHPFGTLRVDNGILTPS
jgi:hypothetical protein